LKSKFSLSIISILFATSLFGWSFDYKVTKDDDGFWGAHYDVPKYSAIIILGLSAYEGTESRLGLASWKSLEAGLISQIATEGLKKATGRVRPRDADGPDEWNDDGGSFPSGHVSGMTALITPYILEYQDDYPLVHLLWGLSAHQMIGRVKAQAHWQSDVIGGAIVGFLSGYWAYKQKTPLLLYFNNGNTFVGLKYKF